MDFLDDFEEPRPRFVVSRDAAAPAAASAAAPSPAARPYHVACCLSLSFILAVFAFFSSSTSSAFSTLLAWLSASFILAPFAPASATGGPLVLPGRGPPLPDPAPSATADPDAAAPEGKTRRRQRVGVAKNADSVNDAADLGIGVKKGPGMAKDPISGRDPENNEFDVVKTNASAMELDDGGTIVGDGDAEVKRGAKFQDNAKLEKHPDGEANGRDGKEAWNSSDDIALLNALKAFPKETELRWEKVAASVPGKTRAACVKRVSELKRDFRSTKSTTS